MFVLFVNNFLVIYLILTSNSFYYSKLKSSKHYHLSLPTLSILIRQLCGLSNILIYFTDVISLNYFIHFLANFVLIDLLITFHLIKHQAAHSCIIYMPSVLIPQY
jgi:hypothetical protein